MQRLRQFCTTSLSAVSLLAISLLGEAALPRPALSAEEIRLVVGGPVSVSLSVDALEAFAQTGEVPPELQPYLRFLGDGNRQRLREGLTRTTSLDVGAVGHLTYSPLGRDALFNFGKVLRVHPEANGLPGLRAALINAAAANPEGWTAIDVLREFPTDVIHIDLRDLLVLRQKLAVYLSYREAVVAAIQTEAASVAAQASIAELPASEALSEAGPYSVTQETFVVDDPSLRQTATGLTVNYDFPVDVYWPQGNPERSPVVIISHGFGDVKESFVFMAEHLASHGFVVMVPDHIGSDLNYRQQYLQGRLNTLLSPMEFLNRPQEISFLIDELERRVETDATWANRLDLNNIGIMGDSLGGATALAVAGAEINYERLTAACDDDRLILDSALYLQCRARFLPPENYELGDERVKAVSVTHPVGGFMYGPEGMSQIDIPLLMISGSNDIISPVVTEQIHPFIWASSSDKVLALLDVGTHFSSKPGREGATDDAGPSTALMRILQGEHRDVGTRYSKALNLAFWQVYLQGRSEYLPYLTSAYGEALSTDQPLRVSIVQSLTPDQLETAYGRTPPVPIVPPAIASTPALRDESILAEIERTGVLKVAFRKDVPPFGFINEADEWDGYCGAIAIALGQHLSTVLDVPGPIQVVELTSTEQNRFDLVREGTVHLECGPNPIREDVPGVAFSNAIYATGAKFLIPNDAAETIRPSLPLAGLRLGVLQDSTTETFVRETYPQANIVPFSGEQDQAQAVQAVASGAIDAFVGDGILSSAETERQNLSTADFTFVPETPLTCEYYGFILPNDDPAWKNLVDRFIRESEAVQTAFAQNLSDLDACLDQ